MSCVFNNNYDNLYQVGSTGKSGSMFFYTSDMKYMMKTIPEREFESFYYVLKNYYEHIDANKNSLITRFFGLHQLSIANHESGVVQPPVYLVSMANIF